jgi:hypothetical protein
MDNATDAATVQPIPAQRHSLALLRFLWHQPIAATVRIEATCGAPRTSLVGRWRHFDPIINGHSIGLSCRLPSP